MFSPVLRRFMEESPVCVAVHATVRRLLSPQWLDELFLREARQQYQDKLLFSAVANLMGQVVCGVRRSIHEAYQHTHEISVSITSVYNKLNHMETGISAALVRDSAAQAAAVLEHLPLPPSPLPGWEVRIADGNCLAPTQSRLKELRQTPDAPLPGKSLVVLDPRRRLMLDVVPCENGHTQERSLMPQLLMRVRAGELWIADSSFCTTSMLTGLRRRGAFFLVRQHASNLQWRPLGSWVAGGRAKRGRVWEQPIEMWDPLQGTWMRLRRIKLELDKPTRNGERTIYVLSNLPASEASAATLADLYKERWRVERAFGEMTTSLRCEINTLGYPPAALFGYCLALAAYNGVSLVKSAMAAAHGQQKVEEEVSFYQLSREVAATQRGLEVAVKPSQWAPFVRMDAGQFAQTLLELARGMDLRRYRKHPRGPKIKRPKPHVRMVNHIATAKLLAQRKASSAGP